MRFARFLIMATCGLLLCLAALATWWHWSKAAGRQAAITRGNELNNRIRQYQRQHKRLPATDDWPALTAAGFTTDEMECAYPQYIKVSADFYQLVFVRGFDGPYLLWDSRERHWQNGFPVVTDKRN